MLANGFEDGRLPGPSLLRDQSAASSQMGSTASSQMASRSADCQLADGFEESRLHARSCLPATTRRCGSGKRFNTHAEAFSLPFVIFAQLGLVFLHLRFQFAERFLATGSDVDSGAGGMQGARRQR